MKLIKTFIILFFISMITLFIAVSTGNINDLKISKNLTIQLSPNGGILKNSLEDVIRENYIKIDTVFVDSIEYTKSQLLKQQKDLFDKKFKKEITEEAFKTKNFEINTQLVKLFNSEKDMDLFNHPFFVFKREKIYKTNTTLPKYYYLTRTDSLNNKLVNAEEYNEGDPFMLRSSKVMPIIERVIIKDSLYYRRMPFGHKRKIISNKAKDSVKIKE